MKNKVTSPGSDDANRCPDSESTRKWLVDQLALLVIRQFRRRSTKLGKKSSKTSYSENHPI